MGVPGDNFKGYSYHLLFTLKTIILKEIKLNSIQEYKNLESICQANSQKFTYVRVKEMFLFTANRKFLESVGY